MTTSAITRTLARILTAISVACTELVWNINSKHSGKVKEQIKHGPDGLLCLPNEEDIIE